jgi:hypothetical protein
MPKQFVLNFQFELRQYRHRKNLYAIISKEGESAGRTQMWPLVRKESALVLKFQHKGYINYG